MDRITVVPRAGPLGRLRVRADGALTAIRVARVDVVGVLTLGMITALGGTAITTLDAAGLSLFAVAGAIKALSVDAGVGQAVILGAVTAVGGGTVRDVLIGRVPVVLRSELYAIPALAGALVLTIAQQLGAPPVEAALGGAALCFCVWMLGVRYGLDTPTPPGEKGS